MKDSHILRVSKSSLNTFQFCRQQYFIDRVIGMKVPQNDAMLRGTNVHDSVELWYQNSEPQYARGLDAAALGQYMKNCLPGPQNIRSKQQEFHLDEDLHLDRFLHAEGQRWEVSEPDHFLPTGNEKVVDCVIELEVDGVKQLVHFTGIIDRIFTNPDGSLHIHELKTGLWKDRPYKWEAMRKEMAFYVWLLRKSDDSARISHWGWDHTRGLADSDTQDAHIFRTAEPVSVRELGLMMADVHELIRAHRRYRGDGDGSMFHLIPEGRQYSICEPWCDLKDFCPRFQQHLGGEEE